MTNKNLKYKIKVLTQTKILYNNKVQIKIMKK